MASDGRGREKRERGKGVVAVYELAETTPFLALNDRTDRPDASSYDSARASDQTRSRIPALQTQDRRIYIYNLICTDGEFRDGVSLRILHDAVIAS